MLLEETEECFDAVCAAVQDRRASAGSTCDDGPQDAMPSARTFGGYAARASMAW